MTARRRFFSIPAVIVAWLVLTPLVPLFVLIGLAVDGIRWLGKRCPFMAIRLVVFGWVYLTAEVVGLGALFLAWVVPGDTVERTWGIQAKWAGVLLAAVERIFSISISVVGAEVLRNSPYVVLMRHASIVDNLLPARLITSRAGVRLRYVLKRELLADPCLDVAGTRLPNHFVDRSGVDSDAEIAAVRRLGDDLPDDQAILIYPEGTRFSSAKRERAIVKVRQSAPHLASRAAGLTHLLPPRPGGVLALLSAKLDVVVCTHIGLDGFASLADIWRGAMVDRTVQVEFWRYPASGLPVDRDALIDWLYGRWMEVDAWVGARA
ncbi:MAG: 1-acyl-sn-glycerol-3-phosphate acyltransferase [Acidimicrobiia bacterium]|nr:1-acyl-sn-glycerol-3-phosphate acyltransferase [Acidimicrobiia bacterium]